MFHPVIDFNEYKVTYVFFNVSGLRLEKTCSLT
jgi:hypothetical protein